MKKTRVGIVWWMLGWLAAGPLLAATPPEWTVVKTPHFTVLTAGKAKEAQAWATDLERFRIALGMLLPVDPKRLAPVVVVIFANNEAFAPYKKKLANGKPEGVDGYFNRWDDINIIGLARHGASRSRVKELIFHESTHWVARARGEKLPLWLDEGMAEVFSTFTADQENFSVGYQIERYVDYLRAVGVPSLRELMGMTRSRIVYDESDLTLRFYAGSWLLVHWFTFGAKESKPGTGSQQVDFTKLAPGPEAACRAMFGTDSKTVEKQLDDYLRGGHYTRVRLKLPAEPLGLEEPRKATDAEVEYALGALLLLGAGNPAEALPHLTRATGLEPGNPTPWEAVGLAQLRLKHNAEAQAAFSRALEAGSTSALVRANRDSLREKAESPPAPKTP